MPVMGDIDVRSDGTADHLTDEEEEYLLEDEEPTIRRTGTEIVDTEPTSFQGDWQAQQESINCQTFDLLALSPSERTAIKTAWSSFLENCRSLEAAGEAIYAALFDSAPGLQTLFKTPRAVMAMKFMVGLNTIMIEKLDDPAGLKDFVDTLGFQHLDIEVTAPRVDVFRDALLDLFAADLGENIFTTLARVTFGRIFNYVGGAFIYIRTNYARRLKILTSSWELANQKSSDRDERGSEEQPGSLEEKRQAKPQHQKKEDLQSPESSMEEGVKSNRNLGKQRVPTTFSDMFRFNAAVMGFADRKWMELVLEVFGTIVTHASNSTRLQEECDVLVLRMSKLPGKTDLREFKNIMLASLRSLLPRTWDGDCEVSWAWLWENVMRMLQATWGKPTKHEKALRRLYHSIEPEQLGAFRTGIYTTFFSKCVQGQDFFKQSTTRLHYIADRVIVMTEGVFSDPRKLMEELSALGLRHVGYGIPTELFGPFVTSCIEALREYLTTDDAAVEAFRWSLGLISRVLVRTITEGATIVMRAINANCGKLLRSAVRCAPRCERANWMVKVQVGTQSISPLLWALGSGSLEAAQAILVDLLTIRADRDNYYYAIDTLFQRHPDLVKKICQDAPALLCTLFDGMIWRSRQTENGLRRVNYYIRYLIVDAHGAFSESFREVVEHGDPKVICHPALVLASDLLWGGVAAVSYVTGKALFVLSLLIFVLTQSVFADHGASTPTSRITTFIGRILIYLLGMTPLLVRHVLLSISAFRSHDFTFVYWLPVPNYLCGRMQSTSAILCLSMVIMLSQEPILYCLGGGKDADDFSSIGQDCERAEDVLPAYTSLNLLVCLLYFLQLLDLAIFSARLSAFVLVCQRMLEEVAQFLLAMIFLLAAFSCGIASMNVANDHFDTIPNAALALMRIQLNMFSGEAYEHMAQEPKLQVAVSIFVIISTVFLLNILIAQLNCAYLGIFTDMFGLARLNRGRVTLEIMPSVSAKRWQRFIASLNFDEKLEFNEGDIGLSGGVQRLEAASAHPMATDSIRRYGGSTSPMAQWPEHGDEADQEDKLDRLEKTIQKAMKRMTKADKKRRTGSSMGSSSIGGGSSSSGSHSMNESE
eukprot:TRINITY_DN58038_c0_g1_i1.p1 TRINITY_DN58038_c0_g1~~TRINITY_DN58038_c0_g1_i1.p1  ORF type:complete len:1102 (-),score=195.31 TRINITY_DN58038_c0_g1_i1:142-3447(-)